MKLFSKILFFFLLLTQFSIKAIPQDVEFPLMQSMCYFPYSDNSLLEKGDFALRVDLHYSNVYMFNHYRTIINDFEMFSSAIGFRYGLSKGMNLELYCRWFALFGGILDKAIDSFHKSFHIPDTNRAEFPGNSVHYRYKDYFFYKNKQSALSPLILALLNNFYTGEHFSLKTRFSIGIPLSNTVALNSGNPFFSAGLIFFYKKKRFSLDFSNYIAWMKKPSWLEEEKLRKQIFFSRLEFNVSRFIAGFTFRSSAFTQGDIAHNASQFYLGYKITSFLDFIILEDFDPFDTSPDLCFYLRINVL